MKWNDVNKELPEYMEGFSTSKNVLLFSRRNNHKFSFVGWLNKFSNPSSVAFQGNNGDVYYKCRSFIDDENWQITHWAYITEPEDIN